MSAVLLQSEEWQLASVFLLALAAVELSRWKVYLFQAILGLQLAAMGLDCDFFRSPYSSSTFYYSTHEELKDLSPMPWVHQD